MDIFGISFYICLSYKFFTGYLRECSFSANPYLCIVAIFSWKGFLFSDIPCSHRRLVWQNFYLNRSLMTTDFFLCPHNPSIHPTLVAVIIRLAVLLARCSEGGQAVETIADRRRKGRVSKAIIFLLQYERFKCFSQCFPFLIVIRFANPCTPITAPMNGGATAWPTDWPTDGCPCV